MNLPPGLYSSLQTLINGDFAASFQFFVEQMELYPGATVLDLGCGTGLLSRQFTDYGIRYVGVDASGDRIAAAKSLNVRADFIVGDVLRPEALADLDPMFVVLHGVVHHLEDRQFQRLLQTLRQKGCRVVGTFDPILPEPTWKHPIATGLCRLDAGRHVRTLDGYLRLWKDIASVTWKVHRSRRWPVEALLMAAKIPATESHVTAHVGRQTSN